MGEDRIVSSLRPGDSIREYRDGWRQHTLVLQIAADVPAMTEELRDQVVADIQASLDRMIREALYNGAG